MEAVSVRGGIDGARAVVAVLVSVVLVTAGLGTWAVLAQPEGAPTDEFTFEEVTGEEGLSYRFDGRQVVNGNNGVYVTDLEGDGWPDLLLVGNDTRGPVLYRNTGTGFEPSGAIPDAVDDYRIHSALFFDYDNDGLEDLLLLPDPRRPTGGYSQSGGAGPASTDTASPLVLHNENGTYGEPRVIENVTLEPYPIGATSADYDGDGCLDVFVYQNGDWETRTPVGFRNPESVGNVTDDNGVRNRLLRGDCEGGFTDVTEAAGIEGERWSLAASFVDLNDDGLPDIHVANDFNRDVVHVNQGDDTFTTRRIPGTDRNGMSSEVGDVNGDGDPDVFVTNIGMASRDGADLDRDTGEAFDRQAAAQSPRYDDGNQLLVNRGNGTFVDRAGEYGVQNAEYVWGWAAVLADLDNDGDLDLVHTNNEKSSITSEGGQTIMRVLDTPPAVWENVGTTEPEFAHIRAKSVGLRDMNGRGMVRVDYDRDGDLDLVVADTDDTVKLYENRLGRGNWLQVELGESRSARTVGATVAVETEDGTQYRFGNVGADFLSQRGRVHHLGLGNASAVEQVTVTWADGSTTTVENVRANLRVRIYPNGTTTRVMAGQSWLEVDEEDMPRRRDKHYSVRPAVATHSN